MKMRVFLFAFLLTLMVSASKPQLGHKFKPSKDSNQSFLSKIQKTFSQLFGSKHKKEESQTADCNKDDKECLEKKKKADAEAAKKEAEAKKPAEADQKAADDKQAAEAKAKDQKKPADVQTAEDSGDDKAAAEKKAKEAEEAKQKEAEAKKKEEGDANKKDDKAAEEAKKVEAQKAAEEAKKAEAQKGADAGKNGKGEEIQTGETIANTNADVELSLPEPFWKTDALSLIFFIIGLLFITTFVYSISKRERASDTLYVELKDNDDFEV